MPVSSNPRLDERDFDSSAHPSDDENDDEGALAAARKQSLEQRRAPARVDSDELQQQLEGTKRRGTLKRKASPVSHAPTPPPTARSPFPTLTDPSQVAPLPMLQQVVPAEATPRSVGRPLFQTRLHPLNKQGYRYVPCGPILRGHQDLFPVPVCRALESPPQVARWSWEDRSGFVLVSEDAQTIMAEKGWRAARSNVCLREGAWYWEINIDRGGGEGGFDFGGSGAGSWVRVGIGRREAPLNAAVGFDAHSYGYRDKTGDAIHLSQPKPFGKPFKSGSIIGIYVSLPPRPQPSESDFLDTNRIERKRIPIRYKGNLFFESLEYPASKEMQDLVEQVTNDKPTEAPVEAKKKSAPPPGQKAKPTEEELLPPPRKLEKLPRSRIAFFVEGECQGVAYEDLYDFVPLRPHPRKYDTKKQSVETMRENHHDDGTMGYYPFVSVFGGGTATINPGPNFAYPPPDDIEKALNTSPAPPKTKIKVADRQKWRPLSDRYGIQWAEQRLLDDIDYRDEVWRAEQAATKPSTATAAPQQIAQAALKEDSPAPSIAISAAPSLQRRRSSQGSSTSPVPGMLDIDAASPSSSDPSRAPSPRGLAPSSAHPLSQVTTSAAEEVAESS